MNENEVIRLEFDYAFDDYREAAAATRETLRSSKGWTRRLIRLFFVIILGLMLLVLFRTNAGGPSGAALPVAPVTPFVARPETVSQMIVRICTPIVPWLVVAGLLSFAARRSVSGQLRKFPVEQFVKPKRGWRTAVLPAGVLLAGIAVLIYAVLRTPDPAGAPPPPVVEFAPWLITFGAIWLVLFGFLQKANVQRVWGGQPLLHLHKVMTLNSTGVLVEDALSRHETNWGAYHRFIETPNLFMLMLGSFTFHMVPKRAFANVQGMDQFRQLLREKVQPQVFAFPVLPMASTGVDSAEPQPASTPSSPPPPA